MGSKDLEKRGTQGAAETTEAETAMAKRRVLYQIKTPLQRPRLKL